MGILSEIYDSMAIGTCLRPLRRVSVLPATESSLTVSKYSSQKTKRGNMQGELSTKILGAARASQPGIQEFVLPETSLLWTNLLVQVSLEHLPNTFQTHLLTLLFDPQTVARLSRWCYWNGVWKV